jgi:hypothetical protein
MMMRASSLWQFSGKLLGSPASGNEHSCAEKEAPVPRTSRGFFRALLGPADTSAYPKLVETYTFLRNEEGRLWSNKWGL